jgi:hypothetical protein
VITQRRCPGSPGPHGGTCVVSNGSCILCHIPYEAPESPNALTRTFSYEAEVQTPTGDDPKAFQTSVKTRGVRVTIPNSEGHSVEVGAEQKDDGPWSPPYVKVEAFKVTEADWYALQRTVERALLEYEARFPADGEVDGAAIKPSKKRTCGGCGKRSTKCVATTSGAKGFICPDCITLNADLGQAHRSAS